MKSLQLAATEKSILQFRKILMFPYICIDGIARTVKAGGVSVHLTAKEFEILYLLACSPDMSLSAREIYRRVWRMEDLGNVSSVRVHVSNLRRKLMASCPGHVFIATTWERGYRFISGGEIN